MELGSTEPACSLYLPGRAAGVAETVQVLLKTPHYTINSRRSPHGQAVAYFSQAPLSTACIQYCHQKLTTTK